MKLLAIVCAALLLTACGQKTVLVQGTGVAVAKPDYIRIAGSVEERANTTEMAVSASSARVENINSKLVDAGIKPEAIAANNFSVRPECRDDKDDRRICDTFVAEFEVVVKTDDQTQASSVLALLVNLGVDGVDRPNAGVNDVDALFSKAREDAVTDARRRAELYAGATGWKLGKVVKIEDGEAYQTVESGKRTVGVGEEIVVTGSRVVRVPLTIEPPRASSSVLVTYELQPQV